MRVWMDGQMRNATEATVECLSNTLHYGVGVFEGERAYLTERGPGIFRLDAHTKRFFAGAKTLGIQIPYSEEEIRNATREVVKSNELTDAYIRPLVYYGGEHLGFTSEGLSVHIVIAAFSWESSFKSVTEQRGLKVQISSYRRVHAHPDLVKVKATGGYLNSVMAHQKAESEGYDEAVLLDTEGYVSEGSGENIFMVKKGIIYTPGLSSALPGITRDTVIKLAQSIDIRVEEKNLTENNFKEADEAFFTGTAVEVVSISQIEQNLINGGGTGVITQRLIDLYQDTVHGRNLERSDWISYCIPK